MLSAKANINFPIQMPQTKLPANQSDSSITSRYSGKKTLLERAVKIKPTSKTVRDIARTIKDPVT